MNNFLHEYVNKAPWHRSIPYVFIGFTIGVLILYLPLPYILVVICGIAVLKATAAKPEIGVLLTVILISSVVFEESLPLIPIGVGSFHLPDILLLFMLGLLLHKQFGKRNFVFVKTPLNLPLLLFFLSVLISAALSILYYGLDFNNVFRMVRTLSYYLIFFLMTNLIRNKSQVRFMVRGLFAIAAVVSAMMLVQAIIGESVQLMPGRLEAAETFGKEFDALRILPPGQTLIFVFFITGICSIVFTRNKSLFRSANFYLTALLGIGVVLTYNRSYWIAVILAVSILLLLTAFENKKRLLSLLAVLTITAFSFIMLFGGSGGKLGKTAEAVSERFGSLFTGNELTESSSLEFRYIENEYAIRQIEKHPFLGSGLRNDYRPNIYGPTDNLTYYVHNGYLWLIKDLGLIGFFFFFWYYVGFLVRGLKYWKRIEDNFLKSAVVGFVLSGIGLLVMAPVNPVFLQWFSIVVISVGVGITETAIRTDENDREESCGELLETNE